MNKTIHFLIATVFLLGSGLLTAQAGTAYRIIVNADNPVSSLTRDQASKMFLKKTARWENGSPVLPVDLSSKSEVREKFSREIHGRSVASIKNYWQQQIFSGRNTPPPEKASEAEVISYVKANPGAIGYVSASAEVDEVKTLEIND